MKLNEANSQHNRIPNPAVGSINDPNAATNEHDRALMNRLYNQRIASLSTMDQNITKLVGTIAENYHQDTRERAVERARAQENANRAAEIANEHEHRMMSLMLGHFGPPLLKPVQPLPSLSTPGLKPDLVTPGQQMQNVNATYGTSSNAASGRVCNVEVASGSIKSTRGKQAYVSEDGDSEDAFHRVGDVEVVSSPVKSTHDEQAYVSEGGDPEDELVEEHGNS